MIRFECDKCRRRLAANDPHRDIVKIEAYAAAGPIDFGAGDLTRDSRQEIETLLDQLQMANPEAIEDQTYRCFRFDLCRNCHAAYLHAPLG